MEYRAIDGLSDEAYEEMLQRGWRRFGYQFFRPVCSACTRCQSMRVLVDECEGSRSQKRALKANSDLRVILQKPSLSQDHLKLFDEYHEDMKTRKGWPDHPTDVEQYYMSFVANASSYGWELLFVEGESLIAVGLIDILPKSISSVYFYYDPTKRHRGLGVFSIMTQIELCRARDLKHLYLGYCVEECPSLAYKANYRPQEILDWDSREGEPIWRRAL